jgi:hypothetical protein
LRRYSSLFTGGERGKKNSVAKIIECVQARYEVENVEFGKVYKWPPESVVLECGCGEETSLTASENACPECGADYRDLLEEVLDECGAVVVSGVLAMKHTWGDVFEIDYTLAGP